VSPCRLPGAAREAGVLRTHGEVEVDFENVSYVVVLTKPDGEVVGAVGLYPDQQTAESAVRSESRPWSDGLTATVTGVTTPT
jgi:hypothetical protein